MINGLAPRPVSGQGNSSSRGTGGSGGLALVSEKEAPKKPVKAKGSTAVQSKDRDMGAALRSIYQKTIDEPVPDEFVSLLGKLD